MNYPKQILDPKTGKPKPHAIYITSTDQWLVDSAGVVHHTKLVKKEQSSITVITPKTKKSKDLTEYQKLLIQARKGTGPALKQCLFVVAEREGVYDEVWAIFKDKNKGKMNYNDTIKYLKTEEGRWEVFNLPVTDANARKVQIELSGVAFYARQAMEKLPIPVKKPPYKVAEKEKIDINIATLMELKTLPRVGPALASKIIEHRKKEPFTTIEDFLKVKGVGEKLYGECAPYIKVGEVPKVVIREGEIVALPLEQCKYPKGVYLDELGRVYKGTPGAYDHKVLTNKGWKNIRQQVPEGLYIVEAGKRIDLESVLPIGMSVAKAEKLKSKTPSEYEAMKIITGGDPVEITRLAGVDINKAKQIVRAIREDPISGIPATYEELLDRKYKDMWEEPLITSKLINGWKVSPLRDARPSLNTLTDSKKLVWAYLDYTGLDKKMFPFKKGETWQYAFTRVVMQNNLLGDFAKFKENWDIQQELLRETKEAEKWEVPVANISKKTFIKYLRCQVGVPKKIWEPINELNGEKFQNRAKEYLRKQGIGRDFAVWLSEYSNHPEKYVTLDPTDFVYKKGEKFYLPWAPDMPGELFVDKKGDVFFYPDEGFPRYFLSETGWRKIQSPVYVNRMEADPNYGRQFIKIPGKYEPGVPKWVPRGFRTLWEMTLGWFTMHENRYGYAKFDDKGDLIFITDKGEKVFYKGPEPSQFFYEFLNKGWIPIGTDKKGDFITVPVYEKLKFGIRKGEYDIARYQKVYLKNTEGYYASCKENRESAGFIWGEVAERYIRTNEVKGLFNIVNLVLKDEKRIPQLGIYIDKDYRGEDAYFLGIIPEGYTFNKTDGIWWPTDPIVSRPTDPLTRYTHIYKWGRRQGLVTKIFDIGIEQQEQVLEEFKLGLKQLIGVDHLFLSFVEDLTPQQRKELHIPENIDKFTESNRNKVFAYLSFASIYTPEEIRQKIKSKSLQNTVIAFQENFGLYPRLVNRYPTAKVFFNKYLERLTIEQKAYIWTKLGIDQNKKVKNLSEQEAQKILTDLLYYSRYSNGELRKMGVRELHLKAISTFRWNLHIYPHMTPQVFEDRFTDFLVNTLSSEQRNILGIKGDPSKFDRHQLTGLLVGAMSAGMLPVSISAWLGISPFLAKYFGRTTFIAPLANLTAVTLGSASFMAGLLAYLIKPSRESYLKITTFLQSVLLRTMEMYAKTPQADWYVTPSGPLRDKQHKILQKFDKEFITQPRGSMQAVILQYWAEFIQRDDVIRLLGLENYVRDGQLDVDALMQSPEGVAVLAGLFDMLTAFLADYKNEARGYYRRGYENGAYNDIRKQTLNEFSMQIKDMRKEDKEEKKFNWKDLLKVIVPVVLLALLGKISDRLKKWKDDYDSGRGIGRITPDIPPDIGRAIVSGDPVQMEGVLNKLKSVATKIAVLAYPRKFRGVSLYRQVADYLTYRYGRFPDYWKLIDRKLMKAHLSMNEIRAILRSPEAYYKRFVKGELPDITTDYYYNRLKNHIIRFLHDAYAKPYITKNLLKDIFVLAGMPAEKIKISAMQALRKKWLNFQVPDNRLEKQIKNLANKFLNSQKKVMKRVGWSEERISDFLKDFYEKTYPILEKEILNYSHYLKEWLKPTTSIGAITPKVVARPPGTSMIEDIAYYKQKMGKGAPRIMKSFERFDVTRFAKFEQKKVEIGKVSVSGVIPRIDMLPDGTIQGVILRPVSRNSFESVIIYRAIEKLWPKAKIKIVAWNGEDYYDVTPRYENVSRNIFTVAEEGIKNLACLIAWCKKNDIWLKESPFETLANQLYVAKTKGEKTIGPYKIDELPIKNGIFEGYHVAPQKHISDINIRIEAGEPRAFPEILLFATKKEAEKFAKITYEGISPRDFRLIRPKVSLDRLRFVIIGTTSCFQVVDTPKKATVATKRTVNEIRQVLKGFAKQRGITPSSFAGEVLTHLKSKILTEKGFLRPPRILFSILEELSRERPFAPEGDTLLFTPIEDVKGIEKYHIPKLQQMNIYNLHDLLEYFPRIYSDRSIIAKISELEVSQYATIRAEILATRPFISKDRKGLRIKFSDGTGEIQIEMYGDPDKLSEIYKKGIEAQISGGARTTPGIKELVFTSFEIEIIEKGIEPIHTGRIVPIYSVSNLLSQKTMRTIVKNVLESYLASIPEPIPDALRQKFNIPTIKESYQHIHFPSNWENAQKAQEYFKFMDEFLYHLKMTANKGVIYKINRGILSFEHAVKIILDVMPFIPTSAQIQAINEIVSDLREPVRMNRLLSGDVGSGKTEVGISAILTEKFDGYQTAVMCPTTILAEQWFGRTSQWLRGYGKVGLLIEGRAEISSPIIIDSKVYEAGRVPEKALLEMVKEGKIDVLIGTQILLRKDIEYKSLNLLIIDEEQLFGVKQKEVLRTFSDKDIDVLSITATPIPRTMEMTIMGFVPVSNLYERPFPSNIMTVSVPRENIHSVFEEIRSQFKSPIPEQVFWVVPKVENVTERIKQLQGEFKGLKIDGIHGRMPPEKKSQIISDFNNNKIDILVATIVIGAGLDTKANRMIIESPGRLGLATAYQLRGRIGRGGQKAICYILAPDVATATANARIITLLNEAGGWYFAKKDLEIRGPGELIGTRQHGPSAIKYEDLTEKIEAINSLLRESPKLIEESKAIKERLNLAKKETKPAQPEEIDLQVAEEIELLKIDISASNPARTYPLTPYQFFLKRYDELYEKYYDYKINHITEDDRKTHPNIKDKTIAHIYATDTIIDAKNAVLYWTNGVELPPLLRIKTDVDTLLSKWLKEYRATKKAIKGAEVYPISVQMITPKEEKISETAKNVVKWIEGKKVKISWEDKVNGLIELGYTGGLDVLKEDIRFYQIREGYARCLNHYPGIPRNKGWTVAELKTHNIPIPEFIEKWEQWQEKLNEANESVNKFTEEEWKNYRLSPEKYKGTLIDETNKVYHSIKHEFAQKLNSVIWHKNGRYIIVKRGPKISDLRIWHEGPATELWPGGYYPVSILKVRGVPPAHYIEPKYKMWPKFYEKLISAKRTGKLPEGFLTTLLPGKNMELVVETMKTVPKGGKIDISYKNEKLKIERYSKKTSPVDIEKLEFGVGLLNDAITLYPEVREILGKTGAVGFAIIKAKKSVVRVPAHLADSRYLGNLVKAIAKSERKPTTDVVRELSWAFKHQISNLTGLLDKTTAKDIRKLWGEVTGNRILKAVPWAQRINIIKNIRSKVPYIVLPLDRVYMDGLENLRAYKKQQIKQLRETLKGKKLEMAIEMTNRDIEQIDDVLRNVKGGKRLPLSNAFVTLEPEEIEKLLDKWEKGKPMPVLKEDEFLDSQLTHAIKIYQQYYRLAEEKGLEGNGIVKSEIAHRLADIKNLQNIIRGKEIEKLSISEKEINFGHCQNCDDMGKKNVYTIPLNKDGLPLMSCPVCGKSPVTHPGRIKLSDIVEVIEGRAEKYLIENIEEQLVDYIENEWLPRFEKIKKDIGNFPTMELLEEARSRCIDEMQQPLTNAMKDVVENIVELKQAKLPFKPARITKILQTFYRYGIFDWADMPIEEVNRVIAKYIVGIKQEPIGAQTRDAWAKHMQGDKRSIQEIKELGKFFENLSREIPKNEADAQEKFQLLMRDKKYKGILNKAFRQLSKKIPFFASTVVGEKMWLSLDNMLREMPSPQGDMQRALMLGQKSALPPEIYDILVRTGTAHLPAFSGLHVGFVAMLTILALKPFKLPHKVKMGVTLASIGWYMQMLPEVRPSATRAFTMYASYALATMVNERLDSFSTLALAGTANLLINPTMLFDVGAQMSYGAVFSIMLGLRLKGKTRKWWLSRTGRELVNWRTIKGKDTRLLEKMIRHSNIPDHIVEDIARAIVWVPDVQIRPDEGRIDIEKRDILISDKYKNAPGEVQRIIGHQLWALIEPIIPDNIYRQVSKEVREAIYKESDELLKFKSLRTCLATFIKKPKIKAHLSELMAELNGLMNSLVYMPKLARKAPRTFDAICRLLSEVSAQVIKKPEDVKKLLHIEELKPKSKIKRRALPPEELKKWIELSDLIEETDPKSETEIRNEEREAIREDLRERGINIEDPEDIKRRAIIAKKDYYTVAEIKELKEYKDILPILDREMVYSTEDLDTLKVDKMARTGEPKPFEMEDERAIIEEVLGEPYKNEPIVKWRGERGIPLRNPETGVYFFYSIADLKAVEKGADLDYVGQALTLEDWLLLKEKQGLTQQPKKWGIATVPPQVDIRRIHPEKVRLAKTICKDAELIPAFLKVNMDNKILAHIRSIRIAKTPEEMKNIAGKELATGYYETPGNIVINRAFVYNPYAIAHEVAHHLVPLFDVQVEVDLITSIVRNAEQLSKFYPERNWIGEYVKDLIDASPKAILLEITKNPEGKYGRLIEDAISETMAVVSSPDREVFIKEFPTLSEQADSLLQRISRPNIKQVFWEKLRRKSPENKEIMDWVEGKAQKMEDFLGIMRGSEYLPNLKVLVDIAKDYFGYPLSFEELIILSADLEQPIETTFRSSISTLARLKEHALKDFRKGITPEEFKQRVLKMEEQYHDRIREKAYQVRMLAKQLDNIEKDIVKIGTKPTYRQKNLLRHLKAKQDEIVRKLNIVSIPERTYCNTEKQAKEELGKVIDIYESNLNLSGSIIMARAKMKRGLPIDPTYIESGVVEEYLCGQIELFKRAVKLDKSLEVYHKFRTNLSRLRTVTIARKEYRAYKISEGAIENNLKIKQLQTELADLNKRIPKLRQSVEKAVVKTLLEDQLAKDVARREKIVNELFPEAIASERSVLSEIYQKELKASADISTQKKYRRRKIEPKTTKFNSEIFKEHFMQHIICEEAIPQEPFKKMLDYIKNNVSFPVGEAEAEKICTRACDLGLFYSHTQHYEQGIFMMLLQNINLDTWESLIGEKSIYTIIPTTLEEIKEVFPKFNPNKFLKNAHTQELIKALPQNAEVYLAGGFVRDSLLGKEPKDVDYIVCKVPFEGIVGSLISAGYKVDVVGKKFKVVKCTLPDETVIDIALPRKEVSVGIGHKDFEIQVDPQFAVEIDLERRDFTINSFVYDTKKKIFVDTLGGMLDLGDKTIRAVSSKAFLEDPLRIFRAIQFASRLGFGIEPDTWVLMLKAIKEIPIKEIIFTSKLPAERIKEEVDKALLKSPQPSGFFSLAERAGILEMFMPELHNLVGQEQTNLGTDVFEHSLATIDAVPADASIELKLSALLHDIGKKPTAKYNKAKKRITFTGHQKIGAEMSGKRLRKLRYSENTISKVCAIVEEHMFDIKPLLASDKALQRWIGRLRNKGLSVKEILMFRIADRKGRISLLTPKEYKNLSQRILQGEDIIDVAKKVKWLEEQKAVFSLKDLKIRGADVIKISKYRDGSSIQEGPIVGRILDMCFEKVLNKELPNEKESLVEFLKSFRVLSCEEILKYPRDVIEKTSPILLPQWDEANELLQADKLPDVILNEEQLNGLRHVEEENNDRS